MCSVDSDSIVFVPFVENIPVLTGKIPSHAPCLRIQSDVANDFQSVLGTNLLVVQGIFKEPEENNCCFIRHRKRELK